MKKLLLVLSVLLTCCFVVGAPLYAFSGTVTASSLPAAPWLMIGGILAAGAFFVIMSISWKHA